MKPEHIKKLHDQAPRRFDYALQEIGNYREPWRIFRIMAELVEGYQFLRQFKKEVTILGSARLQKTDKYSVLAEKLGGLIAKGGFTLITGGGPGIMEAANKGAFQAGGVSIGLNIQLPLEQVLNPFITQSTSFNFFFTRKVMLTSPANAFVVFPGGFGTLDEFFEIVDYMELGYMPKVPIVLIGSEFWNPLIGFLKRSSETVSSIRADIIDSWHVVDSAEDAYEVIKDVEDLTEICDLSPNNFHCEGQIDWKVFRVMAELVEGFEFLTGLHHGVTVLGTKSIDQKSDYYHAAYVLGQALAARGYPIMTGGQFGVAEAANKGAFEAGGMSVGIGMKVGDKARVNSYLTKSILFHFPFTRKLMITSPSHAFTIFPGGFGTLHQLFEILTLIQTGKMNPMAVVLFDRSFWEPLHVFIKKWLVHHETISNLDDELYQIVDEASHIVKVIDENNAHNTHA